jgi:hypothetical protein
MHRGSNIENRTPKAFTIVRKIGNQSNKYPRNGLISPNQHKPNQNNMITVPVSPFAGFAHHPLAYSMDR